MIKTLVFDLDGTVVDLYGVSGWANMLNAFDPTPYRIAKPLLNMSLLARYLNKAVRYGYRIEIVSWLSKTSNPTYDQEVTQAKIQWLNTHLPSVAFDKINIVPYGTPKSTVVSDIERAVLFDDEIKNRQEWLGFMACEPSEIINILRGLI